MSHNTGIAIDIPRATEEGRVILFNRYSNGRLYYDTAFGEEFFIHDHHLSYNGINRTEPATAFQTHMEHFNANHTIEEEGDD